MNARDDELNRTIDIVARDMTQADVSAGFRGRVLDALEPRPRRGILAASQWAWAGATVVLVAVGIVTWRLWPFDVSTSRTVPASVAASTSTMVPATVLTPPAAAAVETPAEASASTARRRAPAPRPRPRGLAWDAGPTPLADPDPITIDALSPAALEIPGITVAPMHDIQPITIETANPGLLDPQRRD